MGKNIAQYFHLPGGSKAPQVILGITKEPAGNSMEYSCPLMTLENFPTKSLSFIRYFRSTSVVTGEILAKTPLVKEASPLTASLMTLLATAAFTSLLML